VRCLSVSLSVTWLNSALLCGSFGAVFANLFWPHVRFLLNVAKSSGLMGKSFTSFRKFQISGAAWRNVLDENFVPAVCDSRRLKEKERSGRTGV